MAREMLVVLVGAVALVVATLPVDVGAAGHKPTGPNPTTSAPPTGGGGAAAAPGAAAGSPVGAGSGSQNPGPVAAMSRPTLYVLAPQADPATGAAITIEIAMRLRLAFRKADEMMPWLGGSDAPWIMPEPTWALADYANQCINDPVNTIGAISISAVENDSGTLNFIVYGSGYTNLDAFYQVIGCNASALMPATGSISQSDVFQRSRSETRTVTTTLSPSPKASSSPDASSKGVESQSSQVRTDVSPAQPALVSRTVTINGGVTTLPQPVSVDMALMPVRWTDIVSGRGSLASIPLLGIAGAGAYFASKTKTITTTTSTGSEQSNNSTLPATWAIIAGSVQTLGAISLPGINPSAITKRSAADLATNLVKDLVGGSRPCDLRCKSVFTGSGRTVPAILKANPTPPPLNSVFGP